MKISKEHFARLEAAIKPFDTEARQEAYKEGRFARSEHVQNLDFRYRWDLFWVAEGQVRAAAQAAGLEAIKDIPGARAMHPLFQEAQDEYYAAHWLPFEAGYLSEHIDTALRRIVPNLKGATYVSDKSAS